MSASKPTDSRALLEHASWVRALAHSLVADHALADDLAQDTCVAALEHPPASAVQPRGWLRAVLVNFARQAGRAAARRQAREERAAKPEAEVDTLEVLARAAAHRELVDAVMALGEPFRTTILLRFFDELPPRRIARQLGVPIATVHSRMQRGLAQLRAGLDERSHGDRRAWVVALLPLAKQAGPSFPLSMGALAMSAKWKLAAVIAIVLCGGWGVWRVLQEVPALAPAIHAVDAPRAETRLERPIARQEPAREPMPGDPDPRLPLAPVTATPAPEPTPAVLLRGRVLDEEAQPRWGIDVEFQPAGTRGKEAAPERYRARSSGGGAFSMPAPSCDGEILASDDAVATVMAGFFKPGSSIEPVVVVAAQRALAGRVLDEEGHALPGARVELELAADFDARFAQALDSSHVLRVWTESDASGAFELARAPIVSGSRLVTALAGYRSDARPAPEYADTALEIVLSREHVEEHALRGIVVAPDGSAVRGAHVALGTAHVLSDASGGFAFDLAHDEERAERLTAVKRGFLPAEAHAVLDSPGGGPRWPDYVRLRLGGEPARLSGKVVDEKGEPVPHARVWLSDPTFFGVVEDTLAQTENVLAGAASQAELERGETESAATLAPALLVPNLLWNWAEANARGEFELGGLLPRSYSLRVMDPATLVHAELGPFAAGSTGLVLVLRMRDLFPRVAGRVVSGSGQPIAGVRVLCERTVFRASLELANGSQSSSIGWPGPATLTDVEGRFELARIPEEGLFLAFSGDAIVPNYHELTAGEDVERLEVSVTLRCHAQIELAERPSRADSFCILDEDGERLELRKFRGDHEYTSSSFPLADGRSEVFAIAEGARTLVLYLAGKEVERHEIALRPGELNWIRF